MRKFHDVFTAGERRAAMWVAAGCAAAALMGAAADRLMGPSLGWYEQGGAAESLQGVVEATPLG